MSALAERYAAQELGHSQAVDFREGPMTRDERLEEAERLLRELCDYFLGRMHASDAARDRALAIDAFLSQPAAEPCLHFDNVILGPRGDEWCGDCGAFAAVYDADGQVDEWLVPKRSRPQHEQPT